MAKPENITLYYDGEGSKILTEIYGAVDGLMKKSDMFPEWLNRDIVKANIKCTDDSLEDMRHGKSITLSSLIGVYDLFEHQKMKAPCSLSRAVSYASSARGARGGDIGKGAVLRYLRDENRI